MSEVSQLAKDVIVSLVTTDDVAVMRAIYVEAVTSQPDEPAMWFLTGEIVGQMVALVKGLKELAGEDRGDRMVQIWAASREF